MPRLLLLFLFLPPTLHAQTEGRRDSLSTDFFLSLDGYYRYSNPDTLLAVSPTLSHREVQLGWLSLGAAHRWRNVGMSGKLAFGPRARQFYFNGNNEVFSAIREAFAFYEPIPEVQIRAGLFPAFYGFEADDPFDNDLYSNSWSYSLAPTCPAGLEVSYSPSEQWTFLAGRYTQVYTRSAPAETAAYGFLAGYTSAATTINLAALIGDDVSIQRVRAFDLVVDHRFGERTLLGVELNYNGYRIPGEAADRYVTVGGYLRYDFTARRRLSLRGEWLDDGGGFNFAGGSEILAATLALSETIGPLRLFLEGRYDRAERRVLTGNVREASHLLLGFGYLLF